MKKYRVPKRIVATLTVMAILCSSVVVSAEEKEEFIIYPQTQNIITEAQEKGYIDEQYINDISEMFINNIHSNSDEYNAYLIEAVQSTSNMMEKSNEELQKAIEENEKLRESQTSRIGAAEAIALYGIGVQMVLDRGCPQTAEYMKWAKTGNGKTYTHNNDSWAESCVRVPDFYDQVFAQFEEEILATGKSGGTVSGSFEYTEDNPDLDHYVALHNVDYSVTFTKKGVGFQAVFKLTDWYDFAWGTYDNIEIGFGNNYCYAMQLLGLIKPFYIVINYKM